MRTNLAIQDLGDLLERPLLAVLATHWGDGTVLLSPVWHEWRDGGFNVWTWSRDVKARQLRRDPRASILVAESDLPYRALEVRTRAVLVTEEARETARRIAARYIGARAGAFVDSEEDDVIIRLEPGDVRAWDFTDDFGSG